MRPKIGAGFSLGLPILDTPDTGIFKLLLGQNVDLFKFNGYAHASAPFNIASAGVGPIAIRLNGNLAFDLNIDLGYDLNGLRTQLSNTNPEKAADALFQGFYLGSQTQVSLTGGIQATAGPDVIVFSLLIDGGLSATVGLSVNTAHQNPAPDELAAHTYGDDHDPSHVSAKTNSAALFSPPAAVSAGHSALTSKSA